MSELIHCVYFSERSSYGAYAMEYDVRVKPAMIGSPAARIARGLIGLDESLARGVLRPGWIRNEMFMPSYATDNTVLWWALRTLRGEGDNGYGGLRLRLQDEKFLPPEVIHARDSLAA